jgi:hypothetical protein
MYKSFLSILLAMVICLTACDSKKAEETETLTTKQSEQTAITSDIPKFDSDYLVSIYEAQELIKIEQNSLELRKMFCEKAYHPDTHLLVTMGIARRVNPENGQAIPLQMAERAAKLDAMRWAGYGIHWLESNYEPPFGQIQANINQQTTIIDRANVGDSLFIFIATEYQKK